MGWLGNRLPTCLVWLVNEVPARRVSAAVWLERGASAVDLNSDMPAAVFPSVMSLEATVAGVMIGVDPHKGSHTAVVLDQVETVLGQVRVKARADQVEQLRRWAQEWPDRVWAVEGARGLGQLLAQQLIAVGEHVVDVQPKLAARVRLLNTGQVNKNDPNDARSVAVAALRAHDLREVGIEEDTAVLRVWSRRYRDLASLRTQVVCRLHAVLCELVAGGFSRQLTAGQAIEVLDRVAVHGAIAQARLELARDLVADLQRIDAQRREVKRRTARAVTASHTTITDIYGVGPIVAATVLGYVRDIRRFPTRDRFASYNGTAPIEASSGNRTIHRLSRRGNRQLNYVIHMAAVTQIRNRGTAGRAYYDRKIEEGMGGKAALRSLKRKISDSIYARMIEDTRHRDDNPSEDPGGHTGNDSVSSAAGSHPATPALRTSHSRVADNPTTNHPTTQQPNHARGGRRKG
ncbi:MAG: IS110 family transposase [Pseudonocardiales bacterium]|nr:MAG: IS110 family transposase [Pseudonocardiales bacterium]